VHAADADREVYAMVLERREELFGELGAFTIDPPADSLRQRILRGEWDAGQPLSMVQCLEIAAENSRVLAMPRRLEGTELAAAIGGARCVIGLDTGLMHLATALGVPGIWLFGPTDPGLTGPYGRNQTIVPSTNRNAPCRTRECAHGPEGRTCMDMIDLERLVETVDTQLANARS